jgi:hypothetical protein
MWNVVERTEVNRNDFPAFVKTYVLSESNFVSHIYQSKNRKLLFEHAALLERRDCTGHDKLVLDCVKKLDDGSNRADCISRSINRVVQIVLRQVVIDNRNVNLNCIGRVVPKPKSDFGSVLWDHTFIS